MKRSLPLLVVFWSVAAVSASLTKADQPTAGHLQAIQNATDARAADAAYGTAVREFPNVPDVYDAYLRKMISLGRAGSLEPAAKALLGLDGHNALALAVVAFVNSSEGRMVDAFHDAYLARQADPNEPFVAQVAGQLVAWYDAQSDPLVLPQSIRNDVIMLRLLSGSDAYARGYGLARDAMRVAIAPAATPLPPTQPAAGEYFPVYGYAPVYPYFVPGVFLFSPVVLPPMDYLVGAGRQFFNGYSDFALNVAVAPGTVDRLWQGQAETGAAGPVGLRATREYRPRATSALPYRAATPRMSYNEWVRRYGSDVRRDAGPNGVGLDVYRAPSVGKWQLRGEGKAAWGTQAWGTQAWGSNAWGTKLWGDH